MKKDKNSEVGLIKESQSAIADNKKELVANMEDGEHCQVKGKKRKRKSKEDESDHDSDSLKEVNDAEIVKQDGHLGMEKAEKKKHKKNKKEREECSMEDGNDKEGQVEMQESKKVKKRQKKDDLKALNREIGIEEEKKNTQITDSVSDIADGESMIKVGHLEMGRPEKKHKEKKKEKAEGSMEAGIEKEGEMGIEKSNKEKKRQKKGDLKALNKEIGIEEEEKKRDKNKTGKKKKEKEKSYVTEVGDVDVTNNLKTIVAGEHVTSNAKLGTKSLGKNSRERAPGMKKTACDLDPSEFPTPKSQSKKVKFASHVEVFPIFNSADSGENINEADIVRGRRFTKDENEILKQAVLDYVDAHHLGPEGVNMVLNCREHSKLKGCWKEIAAALPHRPQSSVYYRAQTMLNRGNKDKWTKEEIDFIKEMHAKHGADWKSAAQELGRYRVHVKDAYRRNRLLNEKKGHWSQDEYQTLFDLVNSDLEAKAFEERKMKYGMLRDNISWQTISDKHGSRTHSVCCQKWYNNLTSPMVAEGEWEDADDYRLLIALYNLDASCDEEVEWDDLVEHRSGDACRKRWKQMVRHIGEPGTKSFSEQVEVLAKRYCPKMLEVRERLDSRPVVD